jgi:hypothetical protein
MAPDEVTVTTTEHEDPSVLAQAAVAAAALAGAAAVRSQDASDDADEADAKADAALAQSNAQLADAANKPTHEETRAIARAEAEAYARECQEWNDAVAEQEAAIAPEGETNTEGVPDEVLPPSVKKAGGVNDDGSKPRFRDRYYNKS